MSSLALAFTPPIIAHRGASGSAPENTLAAFRLAREQGAGWIELDVKLTYDGVPIIMHDDTLDRTTNGKGNVADAMWAEVQTLDAGSWIDPRYKGERVPQLAEVLRLAIDLDLQVNMELKPCPGRAKATAMVAMIEAVKIWPQEKMPPLISSFDEETLAVAAQLHPEWPRSFAFEEWRDDWREKAAKFDARALTVNADLLTPERMPLLVQSGLAILPYTVNDPLRANELLRGGASAVFTDKPRTILAAI